MKLNNILNRAVMLCGADSDYISDNNHETLKVRGLSAINTVLYDICEMPAFESLSDETEINAPVADAAVYGTAMFLCLAFGDTDKSSLFSKIYSDKRTAVKSGVGYIIDESPKEGGAL